MTGFRNVSKCAYHACTMTLVRQAASGEAGAAEANSSTLQGLISTLGSTSWQEIFWPGPFTT